MPAVLPRIEISLSHIRENARILSDHYGKQGISLMGVSKAVLGHPAIAIAMIEGGVQFIADSRLENISKMKKAGITTPLVLLRTAISQAKTIIQAVDISLNTELATLRALSYYAQAEQTIHRVMLMVELGDRREGILPSDLLEFVRVTLTLPNIQIAGLGCNLACYGGVKPNASNMHELSELTQQIEQTFQIQLDLTSGGNSANHEWYQSTHDVERINNLRLGESILLGRETIHRQAIPGLHTNAFRLIAEVIESKDKPSLPRGEIYQDAFGNVPTIRDRGLHRRVLLALGRQDVLVPGLTPTHPLEIVGASSDHLILDSPQQRLSIGSEVAFSLDYGGLLAAMTSPFITQTLIESPLPTKSSP